MPPRHPDKGGTAISEELVIRFFSALEAGDIGTLREIYAPDAVIWHNDDLLEQPVEDNLKTLAITLASYESVSRGTVVRPEDAL